MNPQLTFVGATFRSRIFLALWPPSAASPRGRGQAPAPRLCSGSYAVASCEGARWTAGGMAGVTFALGLRAGLK